jgi:RNA polymerase sigma-70 factor (ECF subfamily)
MALRLVSGSSPRDIPPAAPTASRQLPTVDSLFRRYSPYVATIATRLLGRDDEVDDVVQDVFLAATRGIGEVADPDAIRGWLATVTVRAARRKLRARRLRAWVGLDRAPSYERVASQDASPEQRALLARIYAALDTLPPHLRIAWALRYLEGQRLDFVAESCGCSLATAKRHIGAAQSRLEEELCDE